MVGQVKALKFVPFVNAEVTLAVERVIKGDAGAEITILQAGQLVPEIDTPGTWRVSTLAYSESAPVLFPGDRALLFLERDSTGTYSVQSFTGHYQLDAEKRVSALPGNPFASQANGRDLDLFLDAASQALARPASH